jgi:hypothetical protein
MKLLMERWRIALDEEEQEGAAKAKILEDAGTEAQALITKVTTAARGDAALAREAIESIIVALQNTLK